MSVELKPCPWCGDSLKVGRVVEGDTFRWRRVQGCCADGPEVRHDTLAENQAAAHEDSERRAIEAWNTRSTQPPAVGVDVSDEMVEVVKFLLGEGPLRGAWFGEEPPDALGPMPRYWWRKDLSKTFAAALRTGGGA